MQYILDNYVIIPSKGQVVYNQAKQPIRPKTFQLLQLLLESDGEVLSKKRILDSVWADTVVDEQVIFQSIREIRLLFKGIDVVRTIPRTGYQWIGSHKVASETKHNLFEIPGFASSTLTALLIFVVLVGSILLTGNGNITENSNHTFGSVVVLPIESDFEGVDHAWVRYGAMDQLISSLQSTNEYGVLETDYVIEVLARASSTGTLETQDELVEAVFNVSGAEVIISQTLTGEPQNYSLLYSIYTKTHAKRGVLFDDSVVDIVNQMTNTVSAFLEQDIKEGIADYSSDFSNALLSEALNHKLGGDLQSAESLLQSAQAADPTNLTARRMLLELFVSQSELGRAKELLDAAYPLAETLGEDTEMVRLHYLHGLVYAQRGELQEALNKLSEAESIATATNDWLYLAYINESRGNISRNLNQFEQAEAYFLEALANHAVLKCPLGESNGYLNLAYLSFVQGDQENAFIMANKALEISQNRQLHSKQKQISDWIDSAFKDT